MKVALIITGFLRSFNYENLKKNILDKYHPDIYLHLSSEEYKKDKYLNKHIRISEIVELLQPKILFYEPENAIMSNLSKIWYKIYRMYRCICENEEYYQMNYDVIIRYRPDTYLLEDPNITLTDTIIIPEMTMMDKHKLEKETDPHICDIFAYGPANLMKQYCAMFEYLQNKSFKVSETVLYHYMKDKNIPYVTSSIKYEMILSQCNIIGICGDSGAGKTKLCELLKPLFGGSDQVLKLECDRYHKWERGNENWQRMTHLNPEANFLCKMREDCFDLKIGKDIYQVDYDHKTGKFTPHERISSKNTVLLCGLHTFLCDQMNNFLDIKIFVDTDKNLQNLWKVQRDVVERGHKLENVLNQIQKRKDDVSLYIEPQKEQADIVIKYYTNDDIADFSGKGDDNFLKISPKIQLKIIIKKKINVYPLLQIFDSISLPYEFGGLESDELIFDFKEENFDAENIFRMITIHFNQKLLNPVKIEMGFNGLIQNIVLFVALSV